MKKKTQRFLVGVLLIILMVFFAIVAASCDDETGALQKEMEMFAQAPVIGPAQCAHEQYAAYNFSWGSYRDSPHLEYYIDSLPPYMDRYQIVRDIQRSFDIWAQEIDKPIIEVSTKDSADLVIQIAFMDGYGGTLGVSEYPPHSPTTPKPRKMIFDKYDLPTKMQPDGGGYDFFTIALHEAGHSLGLMHSKRFKAIMYPDYTGIRDNLWLDDKVGARVLYGRRDPLLWENHFYLYVDSSKKRITKDFTLNEYFSKCSPIPGGEAHYLDKSLTLAAQHLRTVYRTPIKIISSFRTDECNTSVGGAEASQHLLFNAIDFKFVGPRASWAHTQFRIDIQNKAEVFEVLLDLGIRGIGIYRTSAHIDTRNTPGKQVHREVNYAAWGLAIPGALTSEVPEHCGG